MVNPLIGRGIVHNPGTRWQNHLPELVKYGVLNTTYPVIPPVIDVSRTIEDLVVAVDIFRQFSALEATQIDCHRPKQQL